MSTSPAAAPTTTPAEPEIEVAPDGELSAQRDAPVAAGDPARIFEYAVRKHGLLRNPRQRRREGARM